MDMSDNGTFRKSVPNSEQLTNFNVQDCHQIATEAMLASMVEPAKNNALTEEEDNASFVLGYN